MVGLFFWFPKADVRHLAAGAEILIGARKEREADVAFEGAVGIEQVPADKFSVHQDRGVGAVDEQGEIGFLRSIGGVGELNAPIALGQAHILGIGITMVAIEEDDAVPIQKDGVVVGVILNGKGKPTPGGIGLAIGAGPLEMGAQVEISNLDAERPPVIPTHLRPVVIEIIELGDLAFSARDVSIFKIFLGLGVIALDALGGGEIGRFGGAGSRRGARRVGGCECDGSRGRDGGIAGDCGGRWCWRASLTGQLYDKQECKKYLEGT